MKHLVFVGLLFLLIACSGNSKKKDKEEKPSQQLMEKQPKVDTLINAYPIQIGNDKGILKITAIKTIENHKLVQSKFYLELNELADFHLKKELDKSIVIDENSSVHLKDTINGDFFEQAMLKNVVFDFVRGNTLYFNGIIENSHLGKEISGRFNLFYSTKEKGQVYGWITDEIIEID